MGRVGDERSWATRTARIAADIYVGVRDAMGTSPDRTRAFAGCALMIVGVALLAVAALADSYLHRGIETGADLPVVVQPTGDDPATNVDLTLYPEDERARVADALRESGFVYVRQPFSWREIEPRQGQFNWAPYDAIVTELNRQNIILIAVARDAPAWARTEASGDAIDAAPSDPAAFGAFVEALTSRYTDKVPFVQLWEAPNDPAYWGGKVASAADFLPLLAAGFNAANTGSPSTKVILSELAISPPEPGAQTDLEFLEALYEMDADDFFDVVALRLEGGQTSPDDRRVSPERVNLSRAILVRDLMVRMGDQPTAVWATSFGWPTTATVTPDDQAAFVAEAIDRSRREWPWMGLMIHTAFVAEAGGTTASYAMVDAEGRATPLYHRLTDEEMLNLTEVANTGFTPTDAGSVMYEGNWRDQHLEGRTFKTISQTQSTASITFRGTGLIAFLRFGPESGDVRVTLDGQPIAGGAGRDGLAWDLQAFSTIDLPLTLISNLDDSVHRLTITLISEGELTLGGLVVVRDVPFVWPVELLAAAAVITLALAVRSILYLVAVRSGQLQGRSGIDLWPQLPQLPDWRPSRRL